MKFLSSLTLSGSLTAGSIPSPGPIGGIAPAASSFTTLNASGAVTTGAGIINTAGRSSFAATSEAFAISAKYVAAGGSVYFGATDSTSTPGFQISNSIGAALLQGTAGGVITIPGTLGVGGAPSFGTGQVQMTSAGATGFDGLKTASMTADSSFFGIGGYGYDTSVNAVGATINFRCAETWSSTAHGSYIQFRTVAAGSTTLSEKMRLYSNGDLSVSGVITASGITAPITPPVVVNKSAGYTFVLGDANNTFLHPSADTTARTWAIPANSSVAYPTNTTLEFINQNAAGVLTIAITTDTMRWAGSGATGSRSLGANGIAVATKITSTEWLISGTNLY